jgi:streptomycin 3"-adenylyltransferase
MIPISEILDNIVNSYKRILQENLAGIYLHGSLAMDCFNDTSSDIDFLVVVRKQPPFAALRELVETLLRLDGKGPEKGFEMSVLLESDTKNFSYPTPFVLHFSNAHKERYRTQPDYICGGFGDPDLAAHITVLRERGICLYGEPISRVFQPVPSNFFVDSILNDIVSSREEIAGNPVYYVLNLCRVLNYLQEGAICSKKEGGEWAASKVSEYRDVIHSALAAYSSDISFYPDKERLAHFAEFMLNEISKFKGE